MVCGIALGILGDFAASEDAGQEAFLNAWHQFAELRDPSRVRPWLAKIARNAALAALRKRRGHEPLETVAEIADTTPGPDQATASEEEAALVRDSLERLPETYRLPLVLYYRDGQSVRGVADALAISEDAVKQRLARGREMLRERMAGIVESVLTRTGPTPAFTIAVATAIGALSAPAVVAGAVFSTTTAAGGAAASSTSASVATGFSLSKTVVAAAILLAAACVPVGYYVFDSVPRESELHGSQPTEDTYTYDRASRTAAFEDSALLAEWRALHEVHGTNAAAMPVLYDVIGKLPDPFRQQAFHAALLAEWAAVDPRGGYKYFQSNTPAQAGHREQFFKEWFLLDSESAVAALLGGGPGWRSIAGQYLSEIARRTPSHLAEIVSRLPTSERDFGDTTVRDAFSILAESDLQNARAVAEAMSGPHRDQALSGVAHAWAKTAVHDAIDWAKSLPEGTDRDEVIRQALIGVASVDPVAALNLVQLVPPGGDPLSIASTTGSRVLAEAARADFETTAAWLATNPGRVSNGDVVGLAGAVTRRLNGDAAGFLDYLASHGSLGALLPAISHALLNSAQGQCEAVWEWLEAQPVNETTKELRQCVLTRAGYQDPDLALKLAAELPRTGDSDAQLKQVASALINGGQALYRFEKLLESAPERLQMPLVEAAFESLWSGTIGDPQRWVSYLSRLPEAQRLKGAQALATAWSEKSPEEALAWATSLTGEAHARAIPAVVSGWAEHDPAGAADWVESLSAGPERDRSAGALVTSIAFRYPESAWQWAMSISDPSQRTAAASNVIRVVAERDASTARQWIESASLPPETKARLQSEFWPQIAH